MMIKDVNNTEKEEFNLLIDRLADTNTKIDLIKKIIEIDRRNYEVEHSMLSKLLSIFEEELIDLIPEIYIKSIYLN